MERFGNIRLQPEGKDVVSEEYSRNDIVVRQAEQNLRHRELLVRAILIFYGLTLAATLALFYLAGFGIVAFGDNVLISLSGVLIGEVGVGALLMQIIKSIFTSA